MVSLTERRLSLRGQNSTRQQAAMLAMVSRTQMNRVQSRREQNSPRRQAAMPAMVSRTQMNRFR
eukprot:COSAG02_NODE_33991_length_491_cov_0.793367_2_plen_63_part_01